MLEPSIITKYSGPPGTGKSTTLLNVVDRLLASGMAPEDLVFTTFTRAGADEARNRACQRFSLPPGRFPYFRTLHSICFSLLPKKEVMKWSDWAEIGRTLGVMFTTKVSPEEPVPRGHTKGDYLLSLWSLARVLRLPLGNVFRHRSRWLMGNEDMDEREFLHFVESVTKYKEMTGRIDFTDMLELYLADGPLLQPQAMIVDEAQDLSPIQWQVAAKLATGASKVFVAGDDDQCIHEWNGADPNGFILLESKEYSVLPQSYRIPSRVHTLAEKVIGQVQHRLPKKYLPRAEEGRVERIDELHQLDLSKGTWLLLARNLTFLNHYLKLCREKGYCWVSSSVPGVDEGMLAAIRAWKMLRTEAVSVPSLQAMYHFMSSGNRISRGNKKKMEAAAADQKFTHEQLVSDYGLLCSKDQPWETALDAIAPEEKAFLRIVERHEGFESRPRIEIGTIHSAKGKEADNVVLMTDMTYRTNEAFELNPDAEHRVWYVGVTRARQALYILNPRTEQSYPL